MLYFEEEEDDEEEGELKEEDEEEEGGEEILWLKGEIGVLNGVIFFVKLLIVVVECTNFVISSSSGANKILNIPKENKRKIKYVNEIFQVVDSNAIKPILKIELEIKLYENNIFTLQNFKFYLFENYVCVKDVF